MSATIRPVYVWNCPDCGTGGGPHDDEGDCTIQAEQHNLDNGHPPAARLHAGWCPNVDHGRLTIHPVDHPEWGACWCEPCNVWWLLPPSGPTDCAAVIHAEQHTAGHTRTQTIRVGAGPAEQAWTHGPGRAHTTLARQTTT